MGATADRESRGSPSQNRGYPRIESVRPTATVPAMRNRIRAWLALALAIASIAVGAAGYVQPPIQFTGVTLRNEETGLVVDTVDPASNAAGLIEPGMRVIAVNGRPAGELGFDELDLVMSGEFVTLEVEDQAGMPVEMAFPVAPEPPDRLPFLVALGLLAGIALWVRRGLAGDVLRPMAMPLATAAAAPVLVSPVWAKADTFGIAAAIVLPAAATLLLADGLMGRISIALARRIAIGALVLGGVVLPAGVLLFALAEQGSGPLRGIAVLASLAMALSAGLTLITIGGLVVSTSKVDPAQATTRRADRLPILLAALTPVVTAASVAYIPSGFGMSVPLIWLLAVLVVLQANTRVEVLRLQRDTIVAATEAERARLAADLHDDALQQMSVLIRRLDSEGSAADAEMARSIADRLRDVCGDLRLPILDELGAGSALEWLVERIGEASGGEVRLERADTARPPADVELAFFRIAQEALSNAVNHGAPPIHVEYEATAERAALSITDRGTGIPDNAAATAPRAGHYGLLNMRQRAEQIGARLELGRGADGGTSVGLRWASA